MAPRQRAAGTQAAEGTETAMKTGTEAFKTGFEKAVKGYDQFLGYGKETAEAYDEVRHRRGQGRRDASTAKFIPIPSSRSKIRSPPARPCLGSKSVHEAFELQTDFAKSAFEAYVGEADKFSELFTATTKETFAPLQGPRSGLGGSGAEHARRLIRVFERSFAERPGFRPGPFRFAVPRTSVCANLGKICWLRKSAFIPLSIRR